MHSSEPVPFRHPPAAALGNDLQFFNAIDDALFLAADLASDERYIFGAIVSTLSTLLQFVSSPDSSRSSCAQVIDGFLPLLVEQASRDATLCSSVDRVQAIADYLRSHAVDAPAAWRDWCAAASVSDNSEIYPAMDELIASVHRNAGRIGNGLDSLRKSKAGSALHQIQLQATSSAQDELKFLLARFEEWAAAESPRHRMTAQVWPQWRWLARLDPPLFYRIQKMRRSATIHLAGAAQTPIAGPINSFATFVRALNHAVAFANVMNEKRRENPHMRALLASIQTISRQTLRWIAHFEEPAHDAQPSDARAPISGFIAEPLELLEMPGLAGVLGGVHRVAEFWSNLSEQNFDEFREAVYETAIDLELLRTISATRELDDVGHNIRQLLYLVAEGTVPPKHRRQDVRLEDAIARELSLYSWPELPAALWAFRAIEAYWQRWTPPPEEPHDRLDGPRPLDAQDLAPQQSRPAASSPRVAPAARPTVTAHEEERRLLYAVENAQAPWNPDRENVDRGITRAYYRHLLDSSIHALGALPMKAPYSRALALHLRAMRRWTAHARPPTDDQRRLTGQAIEAIAHAADQRPDGEPDTAVRDALAVHDYFQRWPADDEPTTPFDPSGMIADARQFTAVVEGLLADAACLLVLERGNPAWRNVFAALARMHQTAVYGRQIDGSRRHEIAAALLAATRERVVPLPNLPRFFDDFSDALRQTADYFVGRRASSRQRFDELLDVAQRQCVQIQIGGNWESDVPLLAEIDRQLRAMRRWTAGGRLPTPPEQQATAAALSAAKRLRGLEKVQQWADRLQELAAVFAGNLAAFGTAASNPVIVEPTADQIPYLTPGQFSDTLDETLRDTRALAGRGTLTPPAGPQVVWDQVVRQLEPIARLFEKNQAPTRRQREEIHRVLTGVRQGVSENPCPLVHDFLPDLCRRLELIDAYYTWAVTAGPFAGKEIGRLDGVTARCVTLGGLRLAFAQSDGAKPGIYVCHAEKVTTPLIVGDVSIDVMRYLPSTRDLLRLVECEGWQPTAIAWNAHGEYLAYSIPGDAPQVGWCAAGTAGEIGRAAAGAMVWATRGESLILADATSRTLFRHNVRTAKRQDLAALPEDLDPAIPIHLSIPPGGDCLTFTCGRRERTLELWMVEFAGAGPVCRMRQKFPGATAVLPFWTAAGEIGCMAISPAGTHLLSLSRVGISTQTLYRDPAAFEPTAPSMCCNGKYLAFFRPAAAGSELVLLDCDSRKLFPVGDAGAYRGKLFFGDETLSITGQDAATILWLHLSYQRQAVERF